MLFLVADAESSLVYLRMVVLEVVDLLYFRIEGGVHIRAQLSANARIRLDPPGTHYELGAAPAAPEASGSTP